MLLVQLSIPKHGARRILHGMGVGTCKMNYSHGLKFLLQSVSFPEASLLLVSMPERDRKMAESHGYKTTPALQARVTSHTAKAKLRVSQVLQHSSPHLRKTVQDRHPRLACLNYSAGRQAQMIYLALSCLSFIESGYNKTVGLGCCFMKRSFPAQTSPK